MKTLAIIITAICTLFPAAQKAKLNGVYRVEYDKKYELQGYQFTFSDSVYVKKMKDAVTYKGKIEYEKYKVLIRKDKSENPIEIAANEIGKDTIKFSTKNKTDLSLVVNRGKLIKVK